MNSATIVAELKAAGWKFKCSCAGAITCYGPELEELIEACGEDFEDIRHIKRTGVDYWLAECTNRLGICAQSSTPSDAVARLWLALNKRS